MLIRVCPIRGSAYNYWEPKKCKICAQVFFFNSQLVNCMSGEKCPSRQFKRRPNRVSTFWNTFSFWFNNLIHLLFTTNISLPEINNEGSRDKTIKVRGQVEKIEINKRTNNFNFSLQQTPNVEWFVHFCEDLWTAEWNGHPSRAVWTVRKKKIFKTTPFPVVIQEILIDIQKASIVI